MYITPISHKNPYSKRIKHQNNPIFKGKLEDDYFKSAREERYQLELKYLCDKNFDISQKDEQTGSNYLHVALESNNTALINQAILLLGKKAKENPEIAIDILSQKNNEGKTPKDYAQKDALRLIERVLGNNSPKNSQETMEEKPKLNELPKGTVIPIPDLDDFDEEDFDDEKNTNTTDFPRLNEIAGHKKARQILIDEIVTPLNNFQPVRKNGFLIHDKEGHGKSFLLNALAKSLNRNIEDIETINALTDKISDNEKTRAKDFDTIFSKNIIRVSTLEGLRTAIELAEENYKLNNKQAVIIIDEIKAILPDITAPYSQNVINAEQLIENSAQKGFILVATTREKDSIKPESIRWGRFDIHIELKSPDEEERKELLLKYLEEAVCLNENEIRKISEMTSGFSYINMAEFINNLNYNKTKGFENIEKEIKKYAKSKNMGEINKNGTTASYDTSEFRRENNKITFSDVAGMDKIKEKLNRELVYKFNPNSLEWFKKFNRPPLRHGFLFYGPPGCGKTYLAKAIAGEMNLPLYILNSASFKNKFVGESERKLKAIFDQLRNKFEQTGEYSVLFIDEANDILGKRDEMSGYDMGIVNLFLQYLNDAPQNGIIPIVATNYKDKLDEAVLSRLGTEIKIPLPDEALRFALINHEFNKVNELTKDISEDERKYLAQRLGGFSSRDIENILSDTIDSLSQYPDTALDINDFIKEASRFSLEHRLPEINEQNTTSGYDTVIKREKTDYPKDFSDVAGMEEIKEKFETYLIKRLNPEVVERFKKDGINCPIQSNFLLYGPPGSGKTFIAEALSGEMHIPLYKIDASDIKNKYVGESEKQITKIFNQLEEKYRETGEYSILFIDEANALLNRRETASNYESGLVDLFLQKINNSAQRGIITLIATNFKDKIDGAILSRLGEQIQVPAPDKSLRLQLISKLLEKRPSAKNITKKQKEELADIMADFSSRDITQALNEILNNHLLYTDKPITFKEIGKGIDTFRKEHEI